MPRPKKIDPAPLDFVRLPADVGDQLVVVARCRRTSVAAEVDALLRPRLAAAVADPAAARLPEEPTPGHRVKMAKVHADLVAMVRGLKLSGRITSAPAAVGAMIRAAVAAEHLKAIGEAAASHGMRLAAGSPRKK